mmetsp:Transcript_3793/g.12395  ORF Transcript_3793/g.12395 Transcript_3793/m.12395 type:complete len:253 (+) Transcript_3793:940-1698(+)
MPTSSCGFSHRKIPISPSYKRVGTGASASSSRSPAPRKGRSPSVRRIRRTGETNDSTRAAVPLVPVRQTRRRHRSRRTRRRHRRRRRQTLVRRRSGAGSAVLGTVSSATRGLRGTMPSGGTWSIGIATSAKSTATSAGSSVSAASTWTVARECRPTRRSARSLGRFPKPRSLPLPSQLPDRLLRRNLSRRHRRRRRKTQVRRRVRSRRPVPRRSFRADVEVRREVFCGRQPRTISTPATCTPRARKKRPSCR